MAFFHGYLSTLIFSISAILICSISVSSFELVLSSNRELLLFANNNSEPRRLKFPKQILALGSDLNENVFVATQSEMAIFSAFVKNYTIPLPRHAFSLVLPDTQNGRIFVANKTSISALKSNVVQEELYQGSSLTSLSFDACTNSLMFIDDQRIYRNFTEQLPNTEGAQLLASHSGSTLFIAKNQALLHSDGFLLKTSKNSLICQSDAEKLFNIRSIQLGTRNDLFLADAHNSVIWHLDLIGQKSLNCDLKVWIRLTSQPNHIAILNSPQDCIYAKDQTISYQINHGEEEEVIQNASSKSGSNVNDNACLHFCLNGGVCKVTSLGIPYCTCKSAAFHGPRCELPTCLNFCLNNGECRVDQESGRPQCLCSESFFGNRCQNGTSIKAQVKTDYYSIAFFVAIGFNVLLLMALICLCGLHFKRRSNAPQKQLQSLHTGPDIDGKKAPARAISDDKRSWGEPHANSSAVGEAFADFEEEKCIDDKGHSCQALITGDGVVLDLEDCCQMTLCEKPCIKATFRKPANRKKARRIDQQKPIY